MKTLYWQCDTCHTKIEKSEDGYIEWIIHRDHSGRRRGSNLRLVHHFPTSPLGGRNGCQSDPGVVQRRNNGVLHDLPLPVFLGSDGITLLLELIEEKTLPTEQVVEMIRRLHVPGYEFARQHSDRAPKHDVLEIAAVPGYWKQADIGAMMQYLSVR